MTDHLPKPLSEPLGCPVRHTLSPLPPYRHVPGLNPHPIKDPKGHLYGLDEALPSVACEQLPASWRQCDEYLYGVDLFNRAYFWEAHESWELVWIGAGKTTEPARFVQALIQVSASLLRQHLGTPRGAQNLWVRARGSLQEQEARMQKLREPTYMGLRVEPWMGAVERYLQRIGSPYPFLCLEA